MIINGADREEDNVMVVALHVVKKMTTVMITMIALVK